MQKGFNWRLAITPVKIESITLTIRSIVITKLNDNNLVAAFKGTTRFNWARRSLSRLKATMECLSEAEETYCLCYLVVQELTAYVLQKEVFGGLWFKDEYMKRGQRECIYNIQISFLEVIRNHHLTKCSGDKCQWIIVQNTEKIITLDIEVEGVQLK